MIVRVAPEKAGRWAQRPINQRQTDEVNQPAEGRNIWLSYLLYCFAC